MLPFLFPQSATLAATEPTGSATESFVLELILTAILMFVILSVSTGAAEKDITPGIAVGSVIVLEAMFAGPICGTSHESCSVPDAGGDFAPYFHPPDLPDRSYDWRFDRCSGL
jgi:hypothetical protein